MLGIHNFTQNEIDEKFFQKTAKLILKELKAGAKTEISLAITGESRMRRLNKIYRGKNRVTDVLSFGKKSASDKSGSVLTYLAKAFPRIKKGEDINFIEPPDGVNRLGEVVICYPRAKKQAKKNKHSLEKELVILLVHGILHLFGYDHEQSGKQAAEMKRMEEKILDQVWQS